ncbi:unnamed protein product [Nippostrongylus brasiliensis]|uniref:FOG-3 protein (inferred by orthology to a C. elegans protein) n=1 Tax=Nippostrongylus brasiliensis TaxID=27835 RepID=A0A0N4YEL3_NIPBR|nr:unnamed protein product [Nippostrongylus brasiliensis]
MYTEVKELVNFLAKYLIGKIPRRPASLFTCQLANFLVCRFREHKWDLNDPSKDEHHRVIRSKVKGFTDQLIISAATEMGLCPDEVLECIPGWSKGKFTALMAKGILIADNILLFANPGEVYCSLPAFVTNPTCAAPAAPASNMGAAGRPFYLGTTVVLLSACEVEDAYVQLKLEPVHSANADDNVVLPLSNLMMFSYTPKNHVSYTIKEFSATRFGSHRQRPDHDVMKRIQRQAANRGNASVRSQPPEAGDAPEVKSAAVNPQRPVAPVRPTTGDTTMADIETLKTLTAEQREALVNIIRKMDHPLNHIQQALGAPHVLHAQNAGLLQNSINPLSNTIMASNLADFTLSHYGTNPMATMSMVPKRATGKRRSGNAHGGAWIS